MTLVVLPALLPGGCRCATEAELLKQIERAEQQRVDPRHGLVSELGHKSPAVRARAALALGRIGVVDPKVLKPLFHALADSSPLVRRRAVFALRLLVVDTPRSMALARRVTDRLLARLSRERDRACRREILRTLGFVGGGKRWIKAATAALLSPADRGAALEALVVDKPGLKGPGAKALVDGLVKVLHGAPATERTLAAMAVARCGGTDDSGLLSALLVAGEAEEPSLRRWATRAVYLSDAPRQLDWLARRYRDHSPDVQVAAAEGMVRGGPAGVRRLARKLLQIWRSVSANHFRLTGAHLHPVLVTLDLLSVFADLPDVQATAREMLELADATDAAVSYGAKEALAVDLVHCAAARLLDLGTGELRHAPRCGTAGSKLLTDARRRAVMVDVVRGLKKKGPSWQVQRLTVLGIDDAEPEVQAASLVGLGVLLDTALRLPTDDQAAALNLIEDSVAHRDPWISAAAATSIDRLSGRPLGKWKSKLVHALSQRLTKQVVETEPRLACRLVEALGSLGQPAPEAWRSPIRGVRHCAIRYLKRIPSDDLSVPSLPTQEMTPSGVTRVKMVTNKGVVWIHLTAGLPLTTARLVKLLEKRFYRDVRIRRVVARTSIEIVASGGKVLPPIPCELSSRPFTAGSVGLRLPAGRDSSRGDLFFCLERQPWRDGRFTHVAQVEPGGLEVLRRLLPGDRIKGIYLHRPKRAPQGKK